jgi:hypothetical protein
MVRWTPEQAAEYVDRILAEIRGKPVSAWRPEDGWWNRPECRGHCSRGFDFHAMGTTPRGRHVLKQKESLSKLSKENIV